MGCGSSIDEPATPLSAPTRLCDEAGPGAGCLAPADIEHWLARVDLEILGSKDTPSGKQGAKVLTVAARDAAGRVVFRAKWRAHSTSHSLNVPRREVAAYALQKTFLDPGDYVVPPASGHCFRLAEYRAYVDASATPSFEGIDCVFGVLSYWLEDTTDSDLIDDADLFWQSRSFGRSLANVNLVSFLIEHGDSHPKQFVLTGGDAEPRVYLVDNTIAFSEFRNPSVPEKWDWSRLRVPALPRDSVRRLSRLTPERLGSLRVIQQFEARRGQLVPVRRTRGPRHANAGLRWFQGSLQIGLTDAEIDRLSKRIEDLTRRVESGQTRTF